MNVSPDEENPLLQEAVLLLSNVAEVDRPRAQPCAEDEGEMCMVCFDYYSAEDFFSLRC